MNHDGVSLAQRYGVGERRATPDGARYGGFLIAMRASGNRKFAKHRKSSRAADGVQFAIREWSGAKSVGMHVSWFLITVGLLAYLGPFGTWASLTISDRLLFWAITVGANWVVGNVVFTSTIRAFRVRKWPTWAGLALAAIVTALPGTGTVWLVVAIYLDYQPSDLSGVIELYSKVFVLHLVIGSLVFHLVERTRRQRDIARNTSVPESSTPGERVDDIPKAAPEAALLARLSARSRAKLLHLHMQDHYVEVNTAAGSELLLLRFRDALREVEDVNGLQVHRSHWVARDAVAGVERRGGGRVILRLVNGSRVPVSRSFAPVLKARGWI